MRNLKYGTNGPIQKTEMNSETQRTVLWLSRGGKYWESGTNRRTLLYIGRMNSKVLLYSYIHHLAINHNGKEYFKTCLYVHKRITFLQSRDWQNTVSQLYFNLKNKIKTKLNVLIEKNTTLWTEIINAITISNLPNWF